MLRHAKKTIVGALSVALFAAATVPAGAMPIVAAPEAGAPANIVKVQGPPPGWRGGPPPGPPPRNGYGWNGNAWVPLAILGAGALIIGGAAAAANNNNVAPGNGINPRLYQWCADRYRSYNAYDNTYQPYNGPRQQCYSPYY